MNVTKEISKKMQECHKNIGTNREKNTKILHECHKGKGKGKCAGIYKTGKRRNFVVNNKNKHT